MRTRPLGQTGLEVSELAVGTWGLAGAAYGPVSVEEAERTITRARELGVTLFETADIYGVDVDRAKTLSDSFETTLGKLLESDKEAILCTKGGNDVAASPPRKRFDRTFIITSAARAAERLRRAPDLYLLHHPTATALQRGDALDALQELVSEGVIKGWGVACGDVETARVAIHLGAPVVELAYNLVFQRDLHDLAADIGASKTGVLARSPLSYGLLCGTWSPGRIFPEGDHRRERWTLDELTTRLRQVAALRPLVHDEVHTIRAVALRFVLANRLVSSAVVGVLSAAQLEANVRAIADAPPYMPDDDLAQIPRILRDVGVEV